jgi:protein gp37
MSETTGISWTDATFNSWWGCQKVSPACDHCYAERDAKRFAAGRVLWGAGSERRIFDVTTAAGAKHWKAPFNWAKTMPAKLGRRPRVFCASMGDWLDLDAPIVEFVRLLDTIRLTPELDWLLLSKRIGNWRKRLADAWDEGMHPTIVPTDRLELLAWIERWLDGDAPANVWLGATVIDQAEADRDIPKLLAVPARVRFLSIEPLLGPITLPRTHCDHGSLPGPGGVGGVMCPDCRGARDGCMRLHWVIAGGESGPHARPAHLGWFRSLRDQCAAAGVAFHFKQHGEWAPGCGPDGEGPQRHRWLDGAYSTKVGKAAAGRLLDGVEHNGFPEAA